MHIKNEKVRKPNSKRCFCSGVLIRIDKFDVLLLLNAKNE